MNFKAALFLYALLLGLVLVNASPAAEQAQPLPIAQCAGHVPYGQPKLAGKKDTTVICRAGYFTEHDNEAKIPVWASYTLTPVNALGCEPRTNAFATDQSLTSGRRSTPGDYAGTGYDQGHNVPDGDQSYNLDVERQSFLMSNMLPQLPGFNRGIWKLLETSVRGWAVQRGNSITIYSGPIYDVAKNKTIGPNKVTVPHGFYKIVIDNKTKETLAFVFDHAEGQGNDLTKVISTVAEIQKLTGIDFKTPNAKAETTKGSLWAVDYGALTDAKRKQCKG
jgi:endonuclease G